MSNSAPSTSQIRMAMALLNWENHDLASAAGLSADAVYKIKSGHTQPQPRNRDKIRRAFETHGIEFTDYDGVRRRPPGIEIFEGPERFQDFADYVYRYLEKNGGDVCISVTNEKLFLQYRKDPAAYREKMYALVKRGDVRVRILAKESNFNSIFAEQRWQAGDQDSAPTSFYAFGDNLALISFSSEPTPYIVLHKNSPFADSFRESFEAGWSHARMPPGAKA